MKTKVTSMKITFITILFLGFVFQSFAQTEKKEDVLYLKNGWVIRGEVVKENDRLRIITRDKNEFVFSEREVDKITREDIFREIGFKEKGFSSYTEMGALAANNNSDVNVNTSAFSFQTVNGYKFNQWLFTGVGLGVDLYAAETFIPVFGSLRGDLFKTGSVIPYYFIDAGYGINITGNADPMVENAGGFLFASGIGIKVPFQNSTAFLLSAGFRVQNSSVKMGDARQNNNYERLALRAGFTF